MKIEKVLKKMGMILGSISLIFGAFMFLNQVGLIIKYGGDLAFAVQMIFSPLKVIIASLFIYGFGEMIELLSNINENLQNKE